MVAALDRGVGAILDALAALELADHTIVVFTSDNGGERFSYHWPLRGAKMDLWEGGVRTPALVRWPGRLPAGAACAQTCMSMDWMATLTAMTGGDVDPAATDGMDVSPMLFGEAPVERTLFWRTQWSAAVRRGPWKYLQDQGHEYLYNLEIDEMERANLKRAHADVFADLRARYAEWERAMAPIPDDARMSRDVYRRLEALGPVAPPPR
ncbi:MAG: sulfatase-like hydrolase/transferase [Caulobacterales bacterium]|nr:sulfatase-like hydrolase/transferase [Caulobacterales bacterium]